VDAPQPARRSRWRHVLLIGKLSVAAVLIGWLVRSGTLDVSALSVLVARPGLLAATIAVFVVGVVVGALRWRNLLRLADVRLSMLRALQWHFIGMFFNVAVPGNIGGDVVKSMYVAPLAPVGQRSAVFLIAFVDRLIGVAALVVVAAVAILTRGPIAWQSSPLRELTAAIGVLVVLALIAPVVFLLVIRRSGERLERWTGEATRFARLMSRLLGAARLVSAQPGRLVSTLALAIAGHIINTLLFTALTVAVTQQPVAASTIASIYPLGVLTMIIPISPAGIGVGHVAFDHLFAIVGLTGGATVFNVYLVSQLCPCLLGALPYIAARRTDSARLATAGSARTSD
jgi:uncharacterized protein (TIRG00374 family)